MNPANAAGFVGFAPRPHADHPMPRPIASSVPVPAMSADEIERFCALIESTRPGSCWNWAGYRDSKGYGQFRLDRQSWWAHRVAFTIAHGRIGAGMQVHHTCGNPSCVNPAHLQETTPTENAREGARYAAKNAVEIPF